MERSHFAEQVLFAMPAYKKLQSPPFLPGKAPGSSRRACQGSPRSRQERTPSVFVFNPFAEGYLANGTAFTPVKHQALLAEDLANLPQFLCEPGDIVLLPKQPSASFLDSLKRAGFPLPEFIELREPRIDPADGLCQRKFGSLRPWAWGPDSVKLLEPLFARVGSGTRAPIQYFNDDIARLYSKAWSAGFLKKVLARCGEDQEAQSCPGATKAWLCSEHEVGVAADTLEDAVGAIAAIRDRGHHRVVIKEAHGLAGHNAIRLWEPEILPSQRRWLVHALEHGRRVVVEPWLERVLDFSAQLEMGSHYLKLIGYTGLVNDLKGQFLANWAEPGHARCLPAKVWPLFGGQQDIVGKIQRLYNEVFALLETDLRFAGYVGPVSIDAFVYRAPQGECRVKPVVEINPRYTMGRLTLELMKYTCPGSCGLFRLMNQVQARAEGSANLSGYARSLDRLLPLQLEGESLPRMRQGAFCLNNPDQARVCLATFEIRPTPHFSGWLSGSDCQHFD